MHGIFSFCCITIACYGFLLTVPPASADVGQELPACLEQVSASHPRLFFTDAETAGLKAKIEGDPLLSSAYGHLTAAADALMDREPVKREKEGKRLLSVSRTCLQRVSYLAFAYRMTQEHRYLERAKREMLAAASFSDWNPSHFLDVAEMTAALAIGYDWLYNGLDATAREAVREAIVKKGLETSMNGGGWVRSANNWNQVCHGGLVVGALAVLEDSPDLSQQVIARAIENVPRAMQEYEPDGVYPEGPSYWKYGTTYNLILISALESVLGSDFGLASAKGFVNTPEFYLHATGPTGFFFNFADCGARAEIAPAMHWFAQRRQGPTLLWHEKKELERFAAEPPSGRGEGDRMLPFLLVWGQPLGEVNAPQTLHWKGDGRTPVAMLRSTWRDDATYVGIKGGSPSSNHAHMDTGSFVLDMKGVRWAIDLGSQGYHGLESRGIDLWNMRQQSERWTVFRLNNLSHNTLVVDGQLQQVSGNASITKFSDNETRPFAIVDMTAVYKDQLAQALRGVRLVGEAVLLQDEVKTLDRPAAVRWAMATQAEVTIEEHLTARLHQDGQAAALRVLSPAGAKLDVYDIENPPRDYDEQNPNTRMIGFEVTIPASTVETLAVFIEPDAASGPRPTLEVLGNW